MILYAFIFNLLFLQTAEVNQLADQLRDVRRQSEEESRRRKNAEDKVAMLTANNNSLNSKIEELIQKSGDHSDLLSKLNDELGAKQNEFERRERQMETEIESLLRDKESKENEIRSLRVTMRHFWIVKSSLLSIILG